MNLKIIFIVLVCISSLTAKEKITLEYWTPFTGGDARPMQFIIDKFNNSQNNIVVNMSVLEWGDVYYNTLSDSIKTPKSPDIAIVHGSKIAEFVNKDKLVSIGLQRIDWEDFTDISKSNAFFKDKYYGVPIDNYLLFTYYNKKLLKNTNLIDQNGKLLLNKGEQSFIDFFHTLSKSLPKDKFMLGQPIDNIFTFWIWLNLYYQTGEKGYIEGDKVLFNNNGALQALEFLVKIRDQKIYSNYINDVQGYNYFKYGKSALFITGPWATWSFEQIKDLEFGVAPFPQIFSKQALWSDSHTLAIPKGISKEKHQAALKFAMFVADHGNEWSVAGHIPSKKSILNSKEYQGKPIRSQYAQFLKYAVAMPKHPKLWECNNKMVELISHMMQSKQSAKETLEKVTLEIEKILRK